ncbi:hypothetical protein ACC668_02890 [Rhizobium ruizarguesonis]
MSSISQNSLKHYIDAFFCRTSFSEEDKYRLGPDPFPGLRHFDSVDGDLLIARDQSARSIRERFAKNHIVVVIGGSGSGKSSIVRGRVLREITSLNDPIDGRTGAWYAVTFRPVVAPVTQFAQALWAQIFEPLVSQRHRDKPDDRWSVVFDTVFGPSMPSEAIQGEIKQAAHDSSKLEPGFIRAKQLVEDLDDTFWKGIRAGPANLMIVIDQFEEVFRSKVDRAEQHQIFAMLLHVFKKKPEGVYIAITMRAEDLHRCAQFEGLADVVNSSFFLVDWLTEEELRAAIINPAILVFNDWGISVENATYMPFQSDVVDLLATEVRELKEQLRHKSDHLPLLQHALRVLWRTAVSRWKSEIENGEIVLPQVTSQDACSAFEAKPGDKAGTLLQRCLDTEGRRALIDSMAVFANKLSNDLREEDSTQAVPVSPEIAIRGAFCQMAALDELRRYHREYATIGEIVSKRFPYASPAFAAALQAALELFVDRGLLVSACIDNVTSFDVTHESLIRNWRQLAEWLQVDAAIVKVINESAAFPKVQIRSDDRPILDKIFAPNDAEKTLFTEAWIVAAIDNGAAAGRDGEDVRVRASSSKEQYQRVRTAWKEKVEVEERERQAAEQRDKQDRLREKAALQAKANYQFRRLRNWAFGIITVLIIGGGSTIFYLLNTARQIDSEMSQPTLLVRNIGLETINENLTAPQMGRELMLAFQQYLRLSAQQMDFYPKSNAAVTRLAIDQKIRVLLGERWHVVNTELTQAGMSKGKRANCVSLETNPQNPASIGSATVADVEFYWERRDANPAVPGILVWPRKKGKKDVALLASTRILEAQENDELCLWSDGSILTLTRQNTPSPNVYRMDWQEGDEADIWHLDQLEIRGAAGEKYRGFNDAWRRATESKGDFSTTVVSSHTDSMTMIRTIEYESLGYRFRAEFYDGLRRPFPISKEEYQRQRADSSSVILLGTGDERYDFGNNFRDFKGETLKITSSESIESRVLESSTEDGRKLSTHLYSVQVFPPAPNGFPLVWLWRGVAEFMASKNATISDLEDNRIQPEIDLGVVSSKILGGFVSQRTDGSLVLYMERMSGSLDTSGHFTKMVLAPSTKWLSDEMKTLFQSISNNWTDDYREQAKKWSIVCEQQRCAKRAEELSFVSPWN